MPNQSFTKPDIFDFDDYHSYLKQFYLYRKNSKHGYSYRQFAKDCKQTSPSYLKEVVDRKRKVTQKSLVNIAKGLKFNEQERKYFEALVNYCNSEQSEKDRWLELLKDNSRVKDRYIVGQDEDYTFATHWIYGLIFCFIGKNETHINIKELQERIIFPIQDFEICDALEYLCKKKLITKTKPEHYKRNHNAISTKPESNKISIRAFHRSSLAIASRALEIIPANMREFRSATIKVPESIIPHFKAHIRDFFSKIPKTISQITKDHPSSEDDARGLIQLNIQLFPMTTDHKSMDKPKS